MAFLIFSDKKQCLPFVNTEIWFLLLLFSTLGTNTSLLFNFVQ